jgi:protein disulfide-isomerase A1
MKLLSLFALFAPAFADFEKDGDVLSLGSDSFDAAVEQHDFLLVKFMAPWCGHCKSMAPEFKKAATELKSLDINVALGDVDATVHNDLAEKYGVEGFPTLKFFKKNADKALEYGGGRSASEIVSWIKKKTGPSAASVNSADDLAKLKKDNDVVVVGHFAGVSNSAKFMAAADSMDEIAFGLASEEVAKELNLADNGVVILRTFDEPEVRYTSDDGDLVDFINANSMALVTPFNEQNAPKIFGGDIKNHLLLFIGASDAKNEEIVAAFTESAKANKGKFLFVTVDADDEENDQVLEYFGISGDDCPTVRAIQMSDEAMDKYKPDSEEFTADAFNTFVSGVLDGSVSKFLMSDPIPESNDGPVKVIVGKQFNEIAKDASKGVLVMFYAPWCGHCQQIKPTWEKLGEHFADNDKYVIGKMDATTNEADGEEVQGFPTIKFYPAGEDVEAIDYQGGRDLDSLIKFVESDGTDQPEGSEEDEDDEDYDDEDEEYDEDEDDEDWDEEEDEIDEDDEDIEEPEHDEL